ncbi:MAG: hydantoinase/oxoprolinase family protein [Panacagrimonas sp.]
MRRVSVDIGGTFTDCFVVWDGRYIETKALTTKHNLALGFNEALDQACETLGLSRGGLLSQVDSVRYATTLGTNALIERKGPKIGLLTTAGFKSTITIGRGRAYGEGLSFERQRDVPQADRPSPLVPIERVRLVRERIGFSGEVLMAMDEDDLRKQIRELVDMGAEAIVVCLANSVVNPAHELRIQRIFVEDYPEHMLGAVPMLLSHQVAGRKGEYVRTMSTVLDAFLHKVMHYGLMALELNLRASGYTKPMLVVHNSSGMAQLNSTDALQTVHSGPVSGVAAAEDLARQADLGNVVATDMGGTSYDIGLVVKGGVKFYDFMPVIERWLVTVPMIHLVTLGAGGGSISRYDGMYKTVKCGPESAGSDPGPACYDRGGLRATVTDADLLLGYLDPANYANGHIKLNPRRSKQAIAEQVCEPLDLDVVEGAKLIKRTVDADMANGVATELRAFGYDPGEFTLLSYGGNGPLHACGIARNLGINRILAPPFASVFSACGAGTLNQMHIHEMSTFLVLFQSVTKSLFTDYATFNLMVEELERRGREDLLRQGMNEADIRYRLELDMRYGNQRVTTSVVTDLTRFNSLHDVAKVIDQFHRAYGERFGHGSQSPAAGVRINTVRVCAFVEIESVRFEDIRPGLKTASAPEPIGRRHCHFVDHDEALDTPIYDQRALAHGVSIDGPAVITTPHTTYLVEPNWRFEAAAQNAGWFVRNPSQENAHG